MNKSLTSLWGTQPNQSAAASNDQDKETATPTEPTKEEEPVKKKRRVRANPTTEDGVGASEDAKRRRGKQTTDWRKDD